MAAAGAIRAGQAYVELFTRHNRLIGGLNLVAAKLKAFGAMVTAIGAKLAFLGVAMALPLLGAVKVYADMGSELLDMSERTGFTVEALSGLQFAAEQSGSSLEELEVSLRKMQRTLADAHLGGEAGAKALGKLGLSIAQLVDLTPEQQFEMIAEAISQIADPTMQTAAAMEIFGKSGTKLLPLLRNGAAGIQQLMEQARRLGLVMSKEDAEAAERFGDMMGRLWRQIKMAVFHIGAGLAPTLESLGEWISQVVGATSAWLQENRALVTIIAGVAGGLTAAGLALMLLGPAISAVGMVITFITGAFWLLGAAIGFALGLVGTLLTPLGLLLLTLDGLRGYLVATALTSTDALNILSSGFSSLLGVAQTTWGGITDAIAAGNLQGAMEMAWLGLQVAWLTGINTLRMAWREFSNWFVEKWDQATTGLGLILHIAWTSLKEGFFTIVEALATGWEMFCLGLRIAFTNFVGFFRRAWATVRNIFNPEERRRQIDAINREIDEGNDAAAAEIDRNVRRRQAASRQRGQEARATAGQMLQAADQRQRDRRRDMEKANEADAAEVSAAQQQLQDRADELRRDREEREWQEAEFGGTGRGAPNLGNIDRNAKKVDVAGTFSAFAVQGLASDSLAKRTAEAAEETVQELRGVRREIGNLAGFQVS